MTQARVASPVTNSKKKDGFETISRECIDLIPKIEKLILIEMDIILQMIDNAILSDDRE
jgi:hypothetical protein